MHALLTSKYIKGVKIVLSLHSVLSPETAKAKTILSFYKPVKVEATQHRPPPPASSSGPTTDAAHVVKLIAV